MDRILLEDSELLNFIKNLTHLEEVRQGKIALSAEDPREFSLSFKSIDRLGHFEAILQLGSGLNYENSLNISFEIDPSTLKLLLIWLQGCDIAQKKSKIKTKIYKEQANILNDLLNDWDFIGVVSRDNQGEYSDLINPILSKLEANADKEELVLYIRNIINDRYGLDLMDIDIFVDNILAWWKKDSTKRLTYRKF